MALFAANYLMRPGFGKPGLRQLTNILPHLIATHNDVVIILLVGYRAKSAVHRRVSCSAPMPHRCAFPVHCTVSTDGAFPVAGKSVAYSSVHRCCHSQPAAPQTYSSFSSGCALQLARGGILIRTAPRSVACKAKGLGRGRFPARDARGEAGSLGGLDQRGSTSDGGYPDRSPAWPRLRMSTTPQRRRRGALLFLTVRKPNDDIARLHRSRTGRSRVCTQDRNTDCRSDVGAMSRAERWCPDPHSTFR